MKKFVIGPKGRRAMSEGIKEYWIEVHDGERSRPKKYHITAEDRLQDSINGKKARGVTWKIKRKDEDE